MMVKFRFFKCNNFQFAILVSSRVWGTARPNKKLSQGAGNFKN